ncbi:MAG: O-antigen ligase family protein [Planctomycetes bacterium]|nr:O-antigen ligase family protein [Planctomycetota bacterium]
MIKPASNPTLKSRPAGLGLNSMLLGLCLCVLGLRCVVTESPVATTSAGSLNTYDLAYSLVLSFVLIVAAALWLIRALCRRQTAYRTTGLGIGAVLLSIAAVAGTLSAPDKRSAISDCLIFLTPMLLCALLVQLLDSANKIRLILIALGALGLLCTYECADQYFFTNQDTIDQYERDPDSLLRVVGIDAGTLEHFLFEHRLYSRGVNGFFTTRNSAGAFLLVALVALLTLWSEQKTSQSKEAASRGVRLFIPIFFIIVLGGLVLTRSKAAIGSLCLASLVGALHFRWRDRIRRHWKTVLLSLASVALLAATLLVSYGLRHDRLPGGNSMLVRWQYWRATCQMIADHPILGVGPGNFADAYYRYKPMTAIESIADPHNVLLSLLSQYGPLGLLGFLAMIGIPILRGRVQVSSERTASGARDPGPSKHRFLGYTFVLATFLLCAKPAIAQFMGADPLLVVLSAFMHTLVLVAGLLVLATAVAALSQTDGVPESHTAVTAVLSYGIVALLIASMTDFALFEPGVATSFWTLVACLIARRNLQQQINRRPVLLAVPVRYGLSALLVVCLVLCFVFGVLPVVRSSHHVGLSNQALTRGDLRGSQHHLGRAADWDPLAESALYRQGRLYLHDYLQGDKRDRTALHAAKACFLEAVARNPSAYKSHEKLSNVCSLLGEEKEALSAGERAVRLYPQSGRLRFKLASIYEGAGRVADAVEHYRLAIEIEDQFQKQFGEMYPSYGAPVSRLGKATLATAQERLKQLDKRPLDR